jgi:competence protein ComEC
VVPALAALGVERLDLLIVTHADRDHRGGVPAVLDRVPVAALWLPYGGLEDPAFAPVRAAAAARGVPVSERGAGSPALRAGDLLVEPLWPPPHARHGSRNDRSLAVRVRTGARRLLLPGDLEAAAERALLASGAELHADVLALPHHGSRSSSTPGLLAAVSPLLAIVSAPCHGRFGMPHPEVRARVRGAHGSLWWTGRDGALVVGLGEPLHVWGFAASADRGPRCRRRPRDRSRRRRGACGAPGAATAPRPRRRRPPQHVGMMQRRADPGGMLCACFRPRPAVSSPPPRGSR